MSSPLRARQRERFPPQTATCTAPSGNSIGCSPRRRPNIAGSDANLQRPGTPGRLRYRTTRDAVRCSSRRDSTMAGSSRAGSPSRAVPRRTPNQSVCGHRDIASATGGMTLSMTDRTPSLWRTCKGRFRMASRASSPVLGARDIAHPSLATGSGGDTLREDGRTDSEPPARPDAWAYALPATLRWASGDRVVRTVELGHRVLIGRRRYRDHFDALVRRPDGC